MCGRNSAIPLPSFAGMAELADALDLGSSISDVQVQVLLPVPTKADRHPPVCFCFVWLIGRAESRRIFGFACKTMAISHRENAIAPKAVQTLSSRPRRACRVQVLLTRPSRSGSFFDRVIGFAESHRIFGFACKTMAISHRENAIAPKSVQTLILTSEARVQSSSPVTRTKKGTRPSRSGSFFDRVIGFAESRRIFGFACKRWRSAIEKMP